MSVRLQNTSSLRALILLSSIGCLNASFTHAQAPIIDDGQSINSVRAKSAIGAASDNSSATGELFIQLQSLQQEVMALRGVIEEQSHQLQTLKQQNLDRYNDLDQRFGHKLSVASAASSQNAPIYTNAAPAIAGPALAPAASMETARPEEYAVYEAAYSKLKGQDFNAAVKGFNIFLATYPKSQLAPNSYYWLGKAYLLIQPQDLNKAQAAFAKVGEYPQSNKVPDALYELGKVYFLKGNKAKAKITLQQVIYNYGASGSSAPQLAKQFLDQNLSIAKH